MLFVNNCRFCIVFAVLINLTQQEAILSPCPKILHFEQHGLSWLGILEVRSSSKEKSLTLEVEMSIAAELPSEYKGRIELIDEDDQALNNVYNNLPVRYKIHFPLPNNIPNVTVINFNGQRVCTGPPAIGTFVTTIALKKSLYSGTNGGFISNEEIMNTPKTSFSESFNVNKMPNIDSRFNPASETGFVYGLSKNTNPLILRGEPTSAGDWPWLTAIYNKNQKGLNFICGGSLVSNSHLITAAHCLFKKGQQMSANELLVKVGIHNMHDWKDVNRQSTNVLGVKIYPLDKKSVIKNDIAILIIEPVTFSKSIIPINLWNGNDDLSVIVGQNGSVVGWGSDENGLLATPEPRRAIMTIVSTDTCRASRPEFESLISNKTLCAKGQNGDGPCNRDSGSGFYLWRNGKWTLRGVVSYRLRDPYSYDSCDLNEYIVFVDATKYTSWIKGIIGV